MGLEQLSAPAVTPPISPPAVFRGPWLSIARYAWLTLVIPILGIFVASIPVYFRRLRSVCLEIPCDAAPTPPPGAQALREVGFSTTSYAAYYTALDVAVALGYLAVAALIFSRKSRERVALLGAFTLSMWGLVSVTYTIGAAVEVHRQWRPGLEFAQLIGLISITFFFCVFPDGRFVPRWSVWLATALSLLATPGYIWPDSPADYREWPPLLIGLFLLIWMGSLIGLQVYRYRCVSGPAECQQTKWVVFGVAGSFIGFFAFVSLPFLISPSFHEDSSIVRNLIANTGGSVSMLLLPVSIGIAILRHRLWDVDVVINRTLVYGMLTSVVVGLYVAIVGGVGALLRVGDNLVLSLLATGLIALLFAPLRDRLQRGVNRLMYGQRDEPYRVLSGLGKRLEATLAPDAVLPAIALTLKDALKLTYVAIALKRDGALEVAASAGQPAPTPLRVPLVYQGETIGELALGLRSGTDTFSSSDRRLVEDLARQVSVAVHASQLTADLQRSRERLVTAREEERRRLRHDLHDGLGPTLASMSLQLAAVRNLVAQDPAIVERLTDLKTQMQEAVTDVRRVVYALRPPALDELGLVQALRVHSARLSYDGLQIQVESPEGLPPLSAAVEVAAYRITLEALTNVANHARARNCIVRLSLVSRTPGADDQRGPGWLQSEIIDDGFGMSQDSVAGTGLVSMRERATELGGSFTIQSEPGGGTRVCARLPVGDSND